MSASSKKISLSKLPCINPIRRMKTQRAAVRFNRYQKINDPNSRYQIFLEAKPDKNPAPVRKRNQRPKSQRDDFNLSPIKIEESVYRNCDDTIATLITDINV